jgi:PAS domain S-box-containing protein
MMQFSPQRFEVLYDLSRALHHHHLDLHKIAQTLVAAAGKASGVKHACLMTFRDEFNIDNAYILGADVAHHAPDAELWNQLLTRGLVGFVRHGQRTVAIRNLTTDPRWPNLPKGPYIPRTGSAIGLPLQHMNHVYGVLMLVHPQIDFFDDNMVELLEEMTELGAAALGNALDFDMARHGDARYQALFDEAVVPMILTDARGTIVDVNQKTADFLGRERFHLLHQSITTIHPMKPDMLKERLEMLAKGEEIVFRSEAADSEGQEVGMTVRARRIKMGERDLLEWAEQDVTAHMELEQLRRDLSAMIYHDLRGPLQAVKGSINKLGQVLANHENPAVWTLLQVGIRSTRQLQRMVDSLLDIQRIEEGKAVLNEKVVELRVLLADAAQLVQPLASDSNHRLQFDIVGDLPLVLVDSDMMIRVVTNLMENAIKYTPEGGIIKLGARMSEEGAVISVHDSGPGIPAEMKSAVFDKFSRVKYQDAPKGVGLGLAFCRLAVEIHGGDIWVESEPENGAEFIFTLPPKRVIKDEAELAKMEGSNSSEEAALATA